MKHKSFSNTQKVLIYGAGSAGKQLAVAVIQGQEWELVGFLDDDVSIQGSSFNGYPIFNPNSIEDILDEFNIKEILFAIPSISRASRISIINKLALHNVGIKTIPGLKDLMSGRVAINDLKSLDINDILNRDEIKPNVHLLKKCIDAKTVLVTGAGGSIGSQLTREIAKLNPKTLIILDNSELALYNIYNEISEALKNHSKILKIIPILGSVQNYSRLENIFNKWQPNTIYHAAAYKHVSIVEENISEGIENNIFGTANCVNLAEKYGAEYFVLISTDKAVRPSNIMGATKRAAEIIIQAKACIRGSNKTKFSIVRFGNVLGSSGSVVPLFEKQIRSGKYVTLTHPEVTRYFMTIPEAAQLVIQAGAQGLNGEIFLLQMGEPVKIYDLAKKMITMYGLTIKTEENPHGDIEIKITGLKPGEKLHEELYYSDQVYKTAHPKILQSPEVFELQMDLDLLLIELKNSIQKGSYSEVIQCLNKIVPDFNGVEKIMDLIFCN